MSTLILIIIVVCLPLWAISLYNSLVQKKNQVQEGWSGIDVQLKRRYDLIPNLIETVKAYTKHESSVFAEVTALRAKTAETQGIAEKGQLEAELSLGLSKLIAVAENYPALRANENFMQMQQDFNNIEEQIQLARRYYNGTTREYNTAIQSFPQMIIANYFSFNPYDYFQIENAAEREVPRVDFNEPKKSE